MEAVFLGNGERSMAQGAWGMGQGAWGKEHGAWGMGLGAWGLGQGVRNKMNNYKQIYLIVSQDISNYNFIIILF